MILPLPLPQPQVAAARLFRGAEVPLAPGVPRYFDVGEAVLDAADESAPQPQEFAAAVGPRRAFLVRFGSLDAALPAGTLVTGATLRLSSADGAPVKIRSIRRVVASWKAAGPSVLTGRIRAAVDPGAKPDPKAGKPRVAAGPAPRTSATWRSAAAGRPWARAGATGETDSLPIEGATFAADATGTTVSGLAGAVQSMADRWWENGGFLVTFESEGTIGSSLSPRGRPELEVQIGPGAPRPPRAPDLALAGYAGGAATVTNVGDAPSSDYRVRAVLDGRRGNWSAPLPPLAPGASAAVTLPDGDVRGGKGARLVLEVESSNDPNPRNDALESVLGGPTVAGLRNALAVRLWNAAAEASRYSFAPEGVAARLTFVGGPDAGTPDPNSPRVWADFARLVGLPDVAALNLDAAAMPPVPGAPRRGAGDRFPGLSGGGDARGEAALPVQVDLPGTPDEDPFLSRAAPEPTGGLSLYEAAFLQAGGEPPLPKLAVLRVTTPGGRPLANTALRLYGGLEHVPKGEAKTDANGVAVLGAGVLDTPLLAVVASANGETEVGFVKGSRLRVAAARGNVSAPVADLRLNLPTLPIVRDAALSSAKIVTDSLGSSPAALGALVDENAGTTFAATYPAGGWIEIDLGRDRTLGEVQVLAAALPRRFEWRLRGTGETTSGATRWASEGDWPWTRANRPDAVLGGEGVLYRGTAERGRFLRLVLPEGGEARIGEIRALAAQTGG